MKVGGYLLLLAIVLGFSAAPALAQVTPGDPAGNQTIPEKDRSRPQDMPRARKMASSHRQQMLIRVFQNPPRCLSPIRHRSFPRRELRVARQVRSRNDKVVSRSGLR